MEYMAMILRTISAIILLSSQALAAPSGVTPSTATIAHGQVISISGSGFGVKSPAKPFLWAPFDSGSINPSSLGVVTSWDAVIDNMEFSSTEGVGGTGCMKAANNEGAWAASVTSSTFGWNDYNSKTYLFRKKKLNFDVANLFPTLNIKVWRIWPDTFGQPDMYVGRDCVYTEGVMESCGWFDSFIWEGPENQYNTEEGLLKSNTNSSTSDGSFEMRLNGVSVNTEAIKMKDDAGTMTKNFPIHFEQTPHPGDFQSHYRVWYDDVYLDNSWARVMVGNASTLAASTHVEPQIPSAWSDTGITVTVNRGAFADNDTAYLFVIDSDGVASSGAAITFGASGGTGRTQPGTAHIQSGTGAFR